MAQFRRSAAAAIAGFGTLALLAAPGFAAGDTAGTAGASVQPAHMSGGQSAGSGMNAPGTMGSGVAGSGSGAASCPPGSDMMDGAKKGGGQQGGMHGQGRKGGGMMGGGQQGGMHGQGQKGGGMMGSGMMGAMMGGGMRGQGSAGPGHGMVVTPSKDLTTEDVRHFFEHRLEKHGNKRLKIGEVTQADDDSIIVDIVTQDGSLVQRYKVDRHDGRVQPAE